MPRGKEEMKKIKLTITCSCGFWERHVFFTNDHGYSGMPAARCPECPQLLVWSAIEFPMDAAKTDIDLPLPNGPGANARPTFIRYQQVFTTEMNILPHAIYILRRCRYLY